ncbi:hypothetical protein D9615_000890 [Tricholomella constricta]|uniref:F-box domain-containing protein n=1 Tax=Tricholomella constricta TaxID=117010 RepID=A0A8H5HKP5_9AGAR|nr:hypothetical protein D9615_000890 [Tricholomella constricta]
MSVESKPASLPTELWKEIFDHMSVDELREITLACHSFRDIGVPLLFQTLTLCHSFFDVFLPFKGMRTYAAAGQNIESAMEKLEFYASQPIARWVNSCIITPSRLGGLEQGSNSLILLDAFLRLLPRFSRLSDLECRFITFNNKTLSQLASYTNKLTLVSCELAADDADVSSLPVIRARTLQFQHRLSPAGNFNGGMDKWIHIMDRDTLEDLTVSFDLASVAFFGDLTTLRRFPNVRSLSTSLPLVLLGNFSTMLNCFPSLRHLCIIGHNEENLAEWEATANDLMPCLAPPPLTHYSGPCELVRPDIAKELRSLNLGDDLSCDPDAVHNHLRLCQNDLGNLTYLKVDVEFPSISLLSTLFSVSANLKVIHVRGLLNTMFQQVVPDLPFDDLPPNIEQFIIDLSDSYPESKTARSYAEAKMKNLWLSDLLKECRPSLKTIWLSDWEHAVLVWRREALGNEVTQEFHFSPKSPRIGGASAPEDSEKHWSGCLTNTLRVNRPQSIKSILPPKTWLAVSFDLSSIAESSGTAELPSIHPSQSTFQRSTVTSFALTMSIEFKSKPASLPTELWKEIFDHISVDELREITLACHSFRDIGVPLLFQTLTLCHSFFNVFLPFKGIRKYAPVGQKIESAMEKLEFYASQPIARWVNSCIITPFRLVGLEQGSNSLIIFNAFLRLLPRFSRLSDLDCRFITFNNKTLSQLASLANKLTFVSCELTADDADVSSLPVIRARTLQFQHRLSPTGIFRDGMDKWIHIMDRDTLEDLTVSFDLASVAFFGDLTTLRRFPNVRSLSTSLPFALRGKFSAMLNCFPSLRHLCITGHNEEYLRKWETTANDLVPCLAPPPLTHYSGPCELVRPDIAEELRSLNLGDDRSCDPDAVHNHLRLCQNDLGNLTYLKVSVYNAYTSLLSTLFSLSANLKVIHVTGPRNTMFQQLVPSLPFDELPPNIEQFIIDWSARSHAEAKMKNLRLRDLLKEHRPCLKTIWLSDWGHAVLVWRREASGKEVTQEYHLESRSELESARSLYQQLFPDKTYLDF